MSPDIRALAGRLLDQEVTRIEGIGGGRNSRVYKVFNSDGVPSVIKFYDPGSDQGRDRMDTEFSGFQFLFDRGIREIPRPIALDLGSRCAVYQFLDGVRIDPETVSARDIDQAVDFLTSLKALTAEGGSRQLPRASEACFSVGAILESIRARRVRLANVPGEGAVFEAFRIFLNDAFDPAFDEIVHWCRDRLALDGTSFDAEVSPEQRTLSPSDFGFHNALRLRDRRLVFLDFEHFGWDDPAKMIADFLLHPHDAMAIETPLKMRFLARILDCFEAHREDLAQRVETVFPLFGLKWCTILLNEFVPKDLDRRFFASETAADPVTVQNAQLEKARSMLETVQNTYRQFSHFGDRIYEYSDNLLG